MSGSDTKVARDSSATHCDAMRCEVRCCCCVCIGTSDTETKQAALDLFKAVHRKSKARAMCHSRIRKTPSFSFHKPNAIDAKSQAEELNARKTSGEHGVSGSNAELVQCFAILCTAVQIKCLRCQHFAAANLDQTEWPQADC